MNPVEACPITVKQLTMTLNALLASAESVFGAYVSELSRSHTHTALTAATVEDEHKSFLLCLCGCIKPVMIISATRCPVQFRSFSAALNAVVNPDNVKASVRLYLRF